MEKRERRERYRHSQSMKQKYSTSGRSEQPNGNISNRDARATQDNREKEKTQPPPKVEEKKVIDHTAIPDPHMFDNLKRETDDIAALTAKMHSKRQVFSNWAKYETLPYEDDSQRMGADYETLLRSAQIGSHFQLRSERGWDPKSLPAQSAAFTIDLGVLAASLACLPLYEKLDLPMELFSSDELECMQSQARSAREAQPQHLKRRGKSLEKEGLALYGSLLEKLMERTPSGDQQLPPPVSHTQNPEEDDYEAVNEESDGFNFGTVRALTKDPAIPVSHIKERTDPPKNDKEERSTPPKENTRERPSYKNEPIPVEEDPEEVPFVESTPLPPHGTRRLQSAQNATPEPAVERTVGKEMPKAQEKGDQHDESSVQESGGKKKSRGGKNKANKRKSLEQDKEGTRQSSVSDTGISSNYSENLSFCDVEKNEPPSSLSKVTNQQIGKDHESKLNIADYKVPINEEKFPCTPLEVNLSVDRSKKCKVTQELSGGNVISSVQPDSAVAKSEEKELDEKVGQFAPKKDDELDELLSLRQPVASQHVLNFAVPTSAVKASIDEDETLPISKPVIAEKKEDLEDWLDSMLDD